MAGVTSSTGISSTLGTYSGITSQDIDKLIEAESVPLLKLTNRKTQMTDQQNAWKDVKLRLNTLFTKIENLQKNATFNTRVITSSNSDKVTMTATDGADIQDYQLTVEKLATASKGVSGEIPGLAGKTIYEKLDKTGTLELTNHEGKVSTIKVSDGDSLKEITNKINATTKESGVKASIVNNRLVVASVETGEKNIQIGGDLADDLGFSASEGTYTKGQNAEFTIDGMKVTRPTNIISDVVENVTITLKTETKEPVTIGMKNDDDKLVGAVKELVDQYNAVMDFVAEKLAVGDPSKKDNKTGTLAGDSSLIRLQSSLRMLMTGAPGENGTTTIIKPSEIGIDSKDKTSAVKFDETKFREALKKDPEAIKNFFFNKVSQEVESIDKDGNNVQSIEKVEIGYTKKLKDLMNTYLSDEKGKKSVFTTRTETLSQNLKDLDSRIELFTERIDKKRDYYVKTFSRLDQVMMQAESQMAYLQSQMDSFSAR